jgi:hypothetical protein
MMMGFLADYPELEEWGLFIEERSRSIVIGSDEEEAFGRVEFEPEAIEPLIEALKQTEA